MNIAIAAVREALLANSAVAELVDERITPIKRGRAERGEAPNITIAIASSPPVRTLDGNAGGATTRLTLDCRAESYATAVQLAGTVRAALDDLHGTTPDYGRWRVWFQNQTDDLEDTGDPADLDGSQIYKIMLDFFIKRI